MQGETQESPTETGGVSIMGSLGVMASRHQKQQSTAGGRVAQHVERPRPEPATIPDRDIWLRTIGVNTNGAAAKVMNFDRLGKKVRPGTFGKIKVG